MTPSIRRSRPVLLLTLFVLLFSAVAAPVAAAPGTNSAVGAVKKVVMFASDGMRPDLMEKYAKDGAMPTYKALMKDGITGDNGMTPAFPPNTGVGWYTMATGTYPSEHGSTNNTYFRGGDAFSNRTSFSGAGDDAGGHDRERGRARRQEGRADRLGRRRCGRHRRPDVDFTNFFSNRGVLVGVDNAVEQAGSTFFGVTYQVATRRPGAAGWTNVPAGDPAATPKETTWLIRSTFAAQNPNRTYNVYFYDSVTGGGVELRPRDRQPGRQDRRGAVGHLKVGDFLPRQADGRERPDRRARRPDGRPLHQADLARPDLSNFKLYDTSLARAIATCGAVCNGLPAGGAGEDRLEKYIADNLLPWAAADFAPEEAGVVDEDTYVQQGRDLERAYSLQVINYILGTLQPDTDLAMVGYPFTDEVSHQFMGLVTKTDADGGVNPCYDVTLKFSDDDVHRAAEGRTASRSARAYIRSAYADADEKLGIVRELMGGEPDDVRGLRPRLRAAVVRGQRERRC